jgi:hypothetical protein
MQVNTVPLIDPLLVELIDAAREWHGADINDPDPAEERLRLAVEAYVADIVKRIQARALPGTPPLFADGAEVDGVPTATLLELAGASEEAPDLSADAL